MIPRNDKTSIPTSVVSALVIAPENDDDNDAFGRLSKSHEPDMRLSAPEHEEEHVTSKNNSSLPAVVLPNLITMMEKLQLGTYQREHVSYVTSCNSSIRSDLGRQFFDTGLRLMMSYQHELAVLYFQACIEVCPNAALAHGLIALCHGPNYNFKGDLYYTTTNRSDQDAHLPHVQVAFPSQQVANRYSAAAMDIVDAMQQRQNHYGLSNQPIATKECISNVEELFLSAIRIMTGTPGVDSKLSDNLVGRPYANAMRSVYQKYPDDPDMAYFFVDSLMVLNAWKLYKYPSGFALSSDVDEICEVLERSLQVHHHHPGLLHLYIHLCEMSSQPERALSLSEPLRTMSPHAGHLLHMPTHIDVLLGRYDTCIRSNLDAIQADTFMMEISPSTSGCQSAYFGYILVRGPDDCRLVGILIFHHFVSSHIDHAFEQHNFHMAIYGAILGGMERIAMELATNLNILVNETLFCEHPNLVPKLEKYTAMDLHVMVRFGRWKALLEIEMPVNANSMMYRTATILYGRALALAMNGNIIEATKVADRYDALRMMYPEDTPRYLRSNTVSDVLAVDAVMIRGEIAYKAGLYAEGLALLRKAVDLQDNLNFEEPWGKMQPIRHALGGLLREQGLIHEAESVFRKDLELHPNNPWALTGLIQCLEQTEKLGSCCCCVGEKDIDTQSEIDAIREQLRIQRQMEWADYEILVACECCIRSK